MAQAVQSQWSVEESVRRLKRLHYVLKRLSESMVARIPAEPIYELKTLFSYHSYIFAEQVQLLRRRVGEMREPPLGLEHVPDASLQRIMDDLDRCPAVLPFMAAVYQVLLPEILQACQRIQTDAHPLADAPTIRVAKLIAFEVQDVVEVGQAAVGALANESSGESMAEWTDYLNVCLDAGGRLEGTQFADDGQQGSPLPDPFFPKSFAHHDLTPRRDHRFRDSYNGGVNPEAFLYDDRFSARDKTLMMYYKRIRELDVPEVMATILHELKNEEPWDFYHKMIRQLWDEARHAMMGEVGFVSLGLDWTAIPINFTWSLNLNTQLTARERHGVLFFIEQGLMPKTGKRFEWEVAQESGDPLSELFQDFDWADEVLHAQIGRRWYVPKFGSLNEALDFGDRCWTKVMSHWQHYREQGLTEHRNWWPELYAKACQNWAALPDPVALAYSENYEDSRADLKKLT